MRVFSDDELATLARAPRDQIAIDLGSGHIGDALRALAGVEEDLGAQIDRYTHWISTLFAFVADHDGPAGSALAIHATRDLFAAHPQIGGPGPGVPESIQTSFEGLASSGDVDAALAEVDGWFDRWRTLVDLYRDWISALLSGIYRRYGVDTLVAAHERVGVATMAALTVSVDGTFRAQAESLVRLLTAHSSQVQLLEDDEKLIIVQDPCGTCGRQVIQGRHGDPLNLAVVEEQHLVTWGRGSTTVYRSHVPIWHIALAMKAIGAPWPVNQCPHGLEDKPCTILLYKDPRNPEAATQIPGSVHEDRDL